ncbi:ABC transporter ATP-binding protein [Micromonospora sp. NPDC023644]|uniref:ABC transporter ATP-binding protein n=1 Tax=Micromonospora sp. NPDC023644 TaxID=3154321 RepID=UPI0033C010AE
MSGWARDIGAFGLLLRMAFRIDRTNALLALVLTVANFLSTTVTGLFIKFIVDGGLTGDSGLLALGVAGLSLTSSVGSWAAAGAFSRRTVLEERLMAALDDELIAASARVGGLELYDSSAYLDKLALLRRELPRLAQAYGVLLMNIGLAVRVATTVALLAVVSLWLLLLPLAALPAVYLARYGRGVVSRALAATATDGRLTGHLLQAVTTPASASDLRMFGAVDELRQLYVDRYRRTIRVQTRAALRNSLLGSIGTGLFAAGYVGSIAFMAVRVSDGQATVGDLMMAATLATQVNRQVNLSLALFSGLLMVRNAVTTYQEFLAMVTEAEREHGTRRLEATPTEVTLDGVSFRYPGTDRFVLTDIDLTLRTGTVVALVGENGAGKSTLLNLLLGYYRPTRGTVRVDGVDLGELDPVWWRSQLGAVHQEHVRFEFTAQVAVGLGDVAHLDDDDRVRAAIDRAGVGEMVAQLPSGLSTQLGRSFDQGVDLSGGQWQGVAIARSAMRNSPAVLVLDEPAASIDVETEGVLFNKITSAYRQAYADSLVLLVSHRLANVVHADHIVVLADGAVVEQGDHETLMKAGGAYRRLFDAQAAPFVDALAVGAGEER